MVAPVGGMPRTVDDVDWGAWHPRERAVLCFVRDTERILLIHKKTGLGRGKVNGPGGRIEPGESPVEAAVRETAEETGVVPRELAAAAELSFVFTDGYSLHCTAFTASAWSGEPASTREADPFWCPLDSIPYDRMWADDELWLPRALAGERIAGRFIFDDDAMLSYRITP